jgi:hypothetical protein
MKVGDIVYFKSTYTARYGSSRSKSGSYEYQFCIGDRYRIDVIKGSITNLEDGTSHFAHSEIWNRLITKEEWREIQLNKIGI